MRPPICRRDARRSLGVLGAAVTVLAGALASACSDHASPLSPAASRPAATTATAPTRVASWLAPLGTAAAQPGANDDEAADLALVVCEAEGTACRGAPVATFTRTSGPAGRPLQVDSALGAFAADVDLTSAAFTTRKAYHLQLSQGPDVLGTVDVDIVRGRWALSTPGALAPLRAAATLPIRVRVPRAGVQFEPAAASPLAVVTVTGLPAAYAATPVPITVGGQHALLTRNLDGGGWMFVVPADAPAGATSITFPADSSAGAQSAPLTITESTFLGGSPGAALQTFDTDLATVRAALARAQPVVDPTQDAVLLRRLIGLNATLAQVRQYVASLPAADRDAFAAFYSANHARIGQVFDMLTALANDAADAPTPAGAALQRALGPTVAAAAARTAGRTVAAPRSHFNSTLLGAAGASAAGSAALGPFRLSPALAAAPTASDVVTRCDRYVRGMQAFALLDKTVSWTNVLLQTAAVTRLPNLVAAAAVGTAVSIGMDLAGSFLNSRVVLLSPYGLRLGFTPARVPAGGTGTMGASVQLQSSGATLGTAIVAPLAYILDRLEVVRRGIWAASAYPPLREALFKSGLESVLVQAKDLLNDIANTPIGRQDTERVPIALDRVVYADSPLNPTFWSFTSASAGMSRSFQTTVLSLSQLEVSIEQGGSVTGAEPGCSAATSGSTPAAGINGFVRTAQNADPPLNGGSSYNDPHLRTIDGRAYDFHAAGDFVLSKSTAAGDDFEVQARYRPMDGRPSVSLNAGVAARVAGDVVNVYPTNNNRPGGSFDLVINDETVTGVTALARALPGGGALQVANGQVTVSWPDRTQLAVTGGGAKMLLDYARLGKVEGLLGNYDGDPANDLRVRGGALLDTNTASIHPPVYGAFRDSWRVALGTGASLFRRGPDPWDPAYPRAITRLSNFSPEAVSAAQATCRAAGVIDPQVVDTCAYDILVTGDKSWAAVAVTFDPAIVAVTIAPAFAYLPAGQTREFTAAVTGTTNRDVTWRATGGAIAVTGANSMTYTAPSTPGQYTITATSAQGGGRASTATVGVTAPGAPLRLNPGLAPVRVGAGLRTGCIAFTVPAAVAAPLPVTIRSSDGRVLQVASAWDCNGGYGPAPAGTTTATVTLPAGWSTAFFVVDGLEDQAGAAATVTASAPGYANATMTVTVAPLALRWSPTLPVRMTTGSADVSLVAIVGPQTAPGTGLADMQQAVRPGGRTLAVQFTSSDASVGQIAIWGGAGSASGTAFIAPGELKTPAKAGGVFLRPTGVGVATLSASLVGIAGALPAPALGYRIEAPAVGLVTTPPTVGVRRRTGCRVSCSSSTGR